MADTFFDELAGAQYKEQNNGEYFAPGQSGKFLIHGVVNKRNALKATVILIGEVVESRPKISGGATQTPGTLVKKVYSLSKFAWAIDQLKTDVMNIMGASPKSMSQDQLAATFGAVFNDKQLKGVLCSFDSYSQPREGKEPITVVKFSHLAEANGNSEAEIAARAAKIVDPK